MRLWSLHPRYLDPQGLVALWREGLLAQAVLRGATRGYRNHPQLDRFRAHPEPAAAIAAYLHGVRAEAIGRGYRFDAARIDLPAEEVRMEVTSGQVGFERAHLLQKLHRRAPARALEFVTVASPETHPLFRVVEGPAEAWERAST